MKTNVDLGVFRQWEKDLRDNPSLPTITTSAYIEINELEAFLTESKNVGADCIRICFLRFRDNTAPYGKKKGPDGTVLPGCKWIEAGDGLTQLAVAIVPSKFIDRDENYITKIKDITTGETQLTLIPGGQDEGPTGHNPPGALDHSNSTQD